MRINKIVNRIRKRVSFELSKEKEKYILGLVMSIGQSHHKESNLTPSDSVLQCPTTEPQRLYGKQGPTWSSYVTHILQTAGISNVLSIMFTNRIWKMVAFEPQTFMATPKFFFNSCSWQNKKHFSLSIILLVWCVFSKDKTIRNRSKKNYIWQDKSLYPHIKPS